MPGRPANRSYTDNDLIKAVEDSFSVAEVQRRLGLSNSYNTIKRNIQRLGISTKHFETVKEKTKGLEKYRSDIKWTSNKALKVFNNKLESPYRGIIRKIVLRENLLELKCYNCGIKEWLGKPISFDLDHINGNNLDHRLENLRFLCPNCHRQTSTWGSSNGD